MGRTLKSCTVSWTPTGDPKRILGWNVVLNDSATNPYGGNIYKQVFVPKPSGTDYSWIGQQQTYTIKNVVVDGGAAIYAWVQQVYKDGDSEWLSSTGQTAADDGLASADEINESATRKWAGETGADKTQTAIDGGIVTTGRLEAKDTNGVTKAGITGGDTGDSAVRFWAGATYASRTSAPFRVTQGGVVYMAQGYIGSEQVPIPTVAAQTNSTQNTITLNVGTGGDYADLQSAIDSLPHVLNHDVTINVYPETFTGSTTIRNFIGPGTLRILGSLSGTTIFAANSLITLLTIEATTISILIQYIYFDLNISGAVGIHIKSNPGIVRIYDNEFAGAASIVTTGIYAEVSHLVISKYNTNSQTEDPVTYGHRVNGSIILYRDAFGVTNADVVHCGMVVKSLTN